MKTKMYNLTNVTNATNIGDQVLALDQQAGGIISICILVSVFLVLLAGSMKFEHDFIKSMMFSSLTVSIIAILMWAGQYISWHILIYPILILFASSIIYKFQDGG